MPSITRSEASGSRTSARRFAFTLVACLLSALFALRPPLLRAAEDENSSEPESRKGERVYSLEELLHQAERNHPGLQATAHAIDAAEARLEEVKISPFFQFNATAAFGALPEQRGTPIYSPDSQLPLTNPWKPFMRGAIEGVLPVYTFGKLMAARKAARAGVSVARLDRERTLARLRYDVRRAYFALQLSLDIQQLIGEGQGKLSQAVEKLQKRIDAGDKNASTMDRWRLAAVLAEVEARASEAKRAEESAKAALATLTGVKKVRVSDCPLDSVALRKKTWDQYAEFAASSRPELGMLDAAIQARESELKVYRAGYFPDLAIALEISRSYAPGITDQTNPFILDRANYTGFAAALVARWSLDFPGTLRRVRRARASLLETQARSREAQRGIALEVRLVYEQVDDAGRREEAWARGEKETRAWFIAAAQSYDVGAIEARDLVDALRAYFGARLSHLLALQELNTSIADLERVSGKAVVDEKGWERSCSE